MGARVKVLPWKGATVAHEMRREVVHTAEFLADLNALLGKDEVVEVFLSGLDFVIQRAPEKRGIETLDPEVFVTFAESPKGGHIGVYYQFDPDDAPASNRKVYCIAAR